MSNKDKGGKSEKKQAKKNLNQKRAAKELRKEGEETARLTRLGGPKT